jgi:hypothetical protein
VPQYECPKRSTSISHAEHHELHQHRQHRQQTTHLSTDPSFYTSPTHPMPTHDRGSLPTRAMPQECPVRRLSPSLARLQPRLMGGGWRCPGSWSCLFQGLGARAQVYMLHGGQRGRVNEEWSQRVAEAVVHSQSGTQVRKWRIGRKSNGRSRSYDHKAA